MFSFLGNKFLAFLKTRGILDVCGCLIRNGTVYMPIRKASAPSRQKLELWAAWFVPVLGKISTAMRWHRLEILTTQWCGTGSPRLQFLAGWSTSTTFFNSSYTKHSLFVSLPRCRQSTMPPHRFLPPPCTDANIKHLVYKD